MKILQDLGGDERLFDRDFPDSEEAAFGSSGSAALDPEGLEVLRAMAQNVEPAYGELVASRAHKSVTFASTSRERASVWLWEHPIPRASYLVSVDPMSGKSDITGSGEKDRHSILVLRDAVLDQAGRMLRMKLVARIAPPNQWDDKVIADWIAMLSLYYGGAAIVVEANCGGGIIEELRDAHSANLVHRKEFNRQTQRTDERLGWWTDAVSRRVMISDLRDYVREQKIDIPCRHVVGELATLIVDKNGKVLAAGRHHDDDAMALAMALANISFATRYKMLKAAKPVAMDARRWKSVPIWT
jgi:hypothetical protein